MIPFWFFQDSMGNPLSLEQIIWRFAQFGIFIILIVFGFYFLSLYLKSRTKNPIQAPFNAGYTIFFFVQSLNQLLFIAEAFSSALNSYMGVEIELYLLDDSLMGLDMQLGYMFLLFGISFLCVLFPFEKYVQNKKKYPLSIILILSIAMAIVILVFGNIYPDVKATGNAALFGLMGYGLHPAAALMIIIAFAVSIIGALTLYFRLAKQTSGDLRNRSLTTAIGLLIWMLSVIIGNGMRGQLEDIGIPFASLVGPVMFYVGTFLLAYGFQRK
ncbi:MAG: hypothetical protein ACFFCS_11100 [Candidatus Hodarchaeota archaeon]